MIEMGDSSNDLVHHYDLVSGRYPHPGSTQESLTRQEGLEKGRAKQSKGS